MADSALWWSKSLSIKLSVKGEISPYISSYSRSHFIWIYTTIGKKKLPQLPLHADFNDFWRIMWHWRHNACQKLNFANTERNYIWKYMKKKTLNLNCNNISQYMFFTVIWSNKCNVVSKRDIFKNRKKNYRPQTFECVHKHIHVLMKKNMRT